MKVSIIIPVYNVAPYIERCIKSVMNQTFQDIECILVNDASSDGSITIAERLIADYNGPIRFKIFNHEHNRGVAAARNTGIDAATGDYICFVDSDDEITTDCIEKLSRPILNNPAIEMVAGCYVTIRKDENNIISEQPFSCPQIELTTKTAVRDFFFSRQHENRYIINKLVNRAFVLNNRIYFKERVIAEDFLWYFFYNKYLSHLFIIPDITYKYIKRPNSITTTKNKHYRNDLGFYFAEIANNLEPSDGVREVSLYLKRFSLFYLEGPSTPVYKQVSDQFLKVLKNHHCFKEWLFLKSIVLVSRFSILRKLIWKIGVFLALSALPFLKNIKKQ